MCIDNVSKISDNKLQFKKKCFLEIIEKDLLKIKFF